TPCGADADSLGTKTWSFNWTAPTDSDSITVYMSALSTNHNHATSGDNTYTDTFKLTPGPASSGIMESDNFSLEIFPNPARHKLNVKFHLQRQEDIRISVFNIEGVRMDMMSYMKVNKGTHNQYLNLDQPYYKPGLYLIKVDIGRRFFTRRILII
ncbi:MAG: T9SS type A sorting domain-containing protein, partial [Bacteroidetes bacterium]|nr:T9SS type A sorting domain-containing protein [Bacteroidota bacterium]